MTETVLAYQEALKMEKRQLLRLRASRSVIANILCQIDEDGLLRSVRRSVLRQSIEGLEETMPSSEVEDLVISIPLALEAWNEARLAAEGCFEGTETWKEAFNKSCWLRNRLIENFAALAPKVRMRYCYRLPQSMGDDLESAGMIGLIRGLETFDPAKKGTLKNHLQGWILSSMMSYLNDTDVAKANKVSQSKKADKTSESLASVGHLGRRVQWVNKESESHFVSMDEPVGENGGCEHFSDIIAGPHCNPFRDMDGKEVISRLKKIIRTKDSMNRFLIQSYWSFLPESCLKGRLRPIDDAMNRMREEAARRLAGVNSRQEESF